MICTINKERENCIVIEGDEYYKTTGDQIKSTNHL